MKYAGIMTRSTVARCKMLKPKSVVNNCHAVDTVVAFPVNVALGWRVLTCRMKIVLCCIKFCPLKVREGPLIKLD